MTMLLLEELSITAHISALYYVATQWPRIAPDNNSDSMRYCAPTWVGSGI